MLKKRLNLVWKSAAALFGVWVVAVFFGSVTSSQPKTVQLAPLLQQVQALGDLHAVKYTYVDVHEYESSREPAGWLASLPGGNAVVRAATLNTTTMSFKGTVEAGVDLSQAKVAHSATGITLRLPSPVVYPANVTAGVHDLKRGMFWRDQNISVSAIEDAKQRFAETSIRQGILEEAKKNVRARVGALAKDLSQTSVVISFEDEGTKG
jgi:hypothetical protein